jgi:thiosulfate/3-mercaptopyruvate sulfurtransferase
VYDGASGDDAPMNATSRDSPLISALELSASPPGPSLRIIDCRFDLLKPEWGALAYREGHLPGAIFASLDSDLSGPLTPGTGRHPLPSPQTFAATLGRWGIAPDTEVVAYDQGPGVAASRLWWMLRARGHENVRVLDGGLAAWKAAGLPLDSTVPEYSPTRVDACPFAGVVDSDEVLNGLDGDSICLVDARGADRFAGENETIDRVAGHVPGSRNHPFTLNLGADGRLLDTEALQRAWQDELAGVMPQQLVMMCGSGVSACHNLLALALLGVEGAQLYAGSFSEWIQDPARPVATGAPTAGSD